jgi:endo-1,4-beta-xylanase
MRLLSWMVLLAMLMSSIARAQSVEQYDSNKELPDPFIFSDGKPVATKEDWLRRRAELREMLVRLEYGEMPPAPGNTRGIQLQGGGRSRHFQYKIVCGPDDKISTVLDVLLPPEGKGPFPVILRGDGCWGYINEEMTKAILARGYILAQFNRLEFCPDLPNQDALLYAAYPDHKFGAMAGWAWGYHRCVDFLMTLDFVDKDKIAISGVSRGGKCVALAGATDERIALVNPAASGTGGADCYRVTGKQSEGIARMTKNFPHWMVPAFKEFAGREDRLPFDQHELLALCAPRALLLTESLDDAYCNPHGSFQTFNAAQEVYKFLGVRGKIGLHYRKGPHAQTDEDWNALLDFADQVFKNKPSPKSFDPRPFDDMLLFKWRAPESK